MSEPSLEESQAIATAATAAKDVVLIVDDEHDIAESLATIIAAEMENVRCVVLHSGEDALALLEKSPPDCIVADYRMPGVDGLTLLRRAAELYPAVPRFLITAYPTTDLAFRAVNDAHVSFIIPKPINSGVFIANLRNVLRERRSVTERVVLNVERFEHRIADTIRSLETARKDREEQRRVMREQQRAAMVRGG